MNPRKHANAMVNARIKAKQEREAVEVTHVEPVSAADDGVREQLPENDTAPELDAQKREVAKLAKSNSPRKPRALAIVEPEFVPSVDLGQQLPPVAEPTSADPAPEVVAAITAASVVQQPTNATRDELRRLHAAGGVGKAECARQVYGADATKSQIKQARRFLHQEAGSTDYTTPAWLTRKAQKSAK